MNTAKALGYLLLLSRWSTSFMGNLQLGPIHILHTHISMSLCVYLHPKKTTSKFGFRYRVYLGFQIENSTGHEIDDAPTEIEIDHVL